MLLVLFIFLSHPASSPPLPLSNPGDELRSWRRCMLLTFRLVARLIGSHGKTWRISKGEDHGLAD